MTSPRCLASIATVFLVILSGGTAAAQTITQSGQPYPNRIVDGMNLGYATRPANFTPLGISFHDCAEDMTLQFSVVLAGFTGNASVQVWGSTGSDCTAPTDRGIGATTTRCWGLRTGDLVDPIVETPATYTFNVRVRDLVGWQQTPPGVAEAALPPAQGTAACRAQPTLAAVPMVINFLAVDSSGNSEGTPYQYAVTTDLVAPPEPAGVALSTVGLDLLASWTPNTDKDTVGYDVFFASAPATDAQAGCSAPSLSRLGDADGITITGAGVGSYDIGPAQSDTQNALIVSGVDAMGNITEGTFPTCDTLGTVEEAAAGGEQGPGVACAVVAPGTLGKAGEATPGLGLLAVAWAITRRTRRRAA